MNGMPGRQGTTSLSEFTNFKTPSGVVSTFPGIQRNKFSLVGQEKWVILSLNSSTFFVNELWSLPLQPGINELFWLCSSTRSSLTSTNRMSVRWSTRFLLLPLVVGLLTTRTCLGCPDHCKCLENKQVLCQESGYEHIPSKKIPRETRDLLLTSNKITRVPTDCFKHLNQLQKLILDNNQIHTLAPYAFRGLKNMLELSLQNNPLTVLPTYSLSSLSEIQYLHLGYNRITTIEPHAFAGSHGIRQLSLDGNPISTLRPRAFSDFRNIGIVSMPYDLDGIQSDAFHGFNSVNELTFEGMKSDVLPQFAFRGMEKIAKVIFRDSSIRVIDSGAFTGLKNVSLIAIENSVIGAIRAAAFAGMMAVTELRIRGNRIANLQPRALDGLYTDTDAVSRVVVTGNWVPCDCRLRWLTSNLMEESYCSDPPEYLNWTVVRVPMADIPECHPEDFEPKKGHSEQQKVNGVDGTNTASIVDPATWSVLSVVVVTSLWS
ncbi:leucine-rich repeat-containing protein 70-like isoform X2 [Ornithodoros turicata]|uniref:leucine-rich repeat-containing protein 70-like isoform X2 n=1 Tax=Ornithodoros turicata TaxID=34597 RepID=UPI0031387DA1